VDLAVPGKCTRRFARSAKKSAKCLLNPERAASRYYAGNVTARVKGKAVKPENRLPACRQAIFAAVWESRFWRFVFFCNIKKEGLGE